MKTTWRWLISLAACSMYLVAVAMPAHAAGSTTVDLDAKYLNEASVDHHENSINPDCGANPTGSIAWVFDLKNLDKDTPAGTLTAQFLLSGSKTSTGEASSNGKRQQFVVYTSIDDTLQDASATVAEQTGTPTLDLHHVVHGCTVVSGDDGGDTGGETGGDTGDVTDSGPEPVTCGDGETAVDTDDDGIADTCEPATVGDGDGDSTGGDAGDGLSSGDGDASGITCAEGETATDTDTDGVADTCATSDQGSGDTGSGDLGSGDTGDGTEVGNGDTTGGDTGDGDTGSGDVGSGETGGDSGEASGDVDTETGGDDVDTTDPTQTDVENTGSVDTGTVGTPRLEVLGEVLPSRALATTGSSSSGLARYAVLMLGLGFVLRGFGHRSVRIRPVLNGPAAVMVARLGATIARTPAHRLRKRP